jgi:integrase
MIGLSAFDTAGRRRSPATMPGYHAGRQPRSKGMRYPADPPTVEEIVAVMRHAAADRHGWRLRAMIVVLWRAGLRLQEALALAEHDLDPRRGSVLVRNGKGGRRREVGMDEWGWEHLRPWLSARAELPSGRCSASRAKHERRCSERLLAEPDWAGGAQPYASHRRRPEASVVRHRRPAARCSS